MESIPDMDNINWIEVGEIVEKYLNDDRPFEELKNDFRKDLLKFSKEIRFLIFDIYQTNKPEQQ